jgi:DMSO/TMAO reductase YedYZ molybdopterin-dependent catalytic subunit
MGYDDISHEQTYLETRAAEFVERTELAAGRTRREVLKLAAAAVPALTAAALIVPPRAAATTPTQQAAPRPSAGPRPRAAAQPQDSSPIVKPLPPDWFINYGTNAEMRWDTVDFGYLTPVERFFVRDHTATPIIDPATWQLQIFGSGLRGAPTADQPLTLTYDQLLRFPHRTIVNAIECAGNGRSFFGTQQGTPVSGTQWQLGAIGVAKWTGVPLSHVLAWAGLTEQAVDVMPAGLDATVVVNGTDAGHVRRPFPVEKAVDDVLLAFQMNGEPLPPDHGAPVRVIVPGWVGVANTKWVGQLEVSAQPLYSTWNTTQYRLVGPDYADDQPPLTNQVVKSAFQLARGAELRAGRQIRLKGRSWSGLGAIAHVDVSTNGGQTWHRARLTGPNRRQAWTRWEFPWQPRKAGPHTLLARATDSAGRVQPATVPFNTGGYVFGAVVDHPVTVVAA